jgi:hypothetical protein
LDAADANDDKIIAFADVSYLGNYLFQGMAPPPEPFQGTTPGNWCPGAVGGAPGRYAREHCGPLNPGDSDLGCATPAPTCS